MNTSGWIQLILYVGILLAITKPLGLYLCKVLDVNGKTFLDPVGLVALVVAGGLSCILALALSGAIILSGSDRAMFGRFAKAMTGTPRH